MSALIPPSRVAGRRLFKSQVSKTSKQVRGGAVEVQASTFRSSFRKISTTSSVFNSRQTASAPALSTLDVPATLPDAPSRPLSLTAQRTAARLADTLELLEGEVGGDPEWSRRVEAALEELKTGVGRNGRLAGKPGHLPVTREDEGPLLESDLPIPIIWHTLVYGSPASGFRTVVTTLLADPLTQTEGARQAILDRANEEIGETFVTRSVVLLELFLIPFKLTLIGFATVCLTAMEML